MTEKQRIRFEDIKELDMDTSKAWLFKDTFDKFFSLNNYEN